MLQILWQKKKKDSKHCFQYYLTFQWKPTTQSQSAESSFAILGSWLNQDNCSFCPAYSAIWCSWAPVQGNSKLCISNTSIKRQEGNRKCSLQWQLQEAPSSARTPTDSWWPSGAAPRNPALRAKSWTCLWLFQLSLTSAWSLEDACRLLNLAHLLR